jgi:hypothetical protein
MQIFAVCSSRPARFDQLTHPPDRRQPEAARFRPYDLAVVAREEARDEYFTVSATGVVRIRTGEQVRWEAGVGVLGWREGVVLIHRGSGCPGGVLEAKPEREQRDGMRGSCQRPPNQPTNEPRPSSRRCPSGCARRRCLTPWRQSGSSGTT